MLAWVLGLITILRVAHCETDYDEMDYYFEGWKEVDDRLIGFYTKSATWQDAQNQCEKVGATLVIDDAPAINSHLNSLGMYMRVCPSDRLAVASVPNAITWDAC